MSFFGIGPLELVFILIIMILVLGPKNMVITARKLGVTLRKIVKSPLWATVMDTSREIREIPTRLIREAGIEEDLKNIKSTTDSLKDLGNISVPYDLSKTEKQKIETEKDLAIPDQSIIEPTKENTSPKNASFDQDKEKEVEEEQKEKKSDQLINEPSEENSSIKNASIDHDNLSEVEEDQAEEKSKKPPIRG